MYDVTDQLQELQRDLNDGEDLSMALALIGDSFHRRIRRVKRSLAALDPGPDQDELRRRLQDTLERYEAEVAAGRERIARIIDDFQRLLGDEADDLGGGSPDG